MTHGEATGSNVLNATVFAVVALCIVAVVSEIGAQGVFFLVNGVRYDNDRVAEAAIAAAGDFEEPQDLRDEVPGHTSNRVVHPYFGTISARAEREVPELHGFIDFADSSTPPERFDEANVNILLIGGSVASQVGLYGPLWQVFEERAAALGFDDIRTRVFVAANGGYKQPQQLMILSYFVANGAKFDIVINVDGFNEVVLPLAENLPAGVHPSFPRSWDDQMRLATGNVDYTLLSEAVRIRLELNGLGVGAQSGRWWSGSAVYGILAMRKIAGLSERLNDVERALQDYAAAYPISTHGPEFTQTREEVLEISVDLWHRSSLTLAAFSKSIGAEYYHFLQPNQYVEGSKIFTDEERQNYIHLSPYGSYGELATYAYPALIAAGESILSEKIDYFDATDLFKNETDTIYKDACCHYNRRGSKLFAEFIASVVLESTNVFESKSMQLGER